MATQSNLDWFDDRWVTGFVSLWTVPSRLAARHQIPPDTPPGWTAP
jgi:hypothetical protein